MSKVHKLELKRQQYTIPYFTVQGRKYSQRKLLDLLIFGIDYLKNQIDALSFLTNFDPALNQNLPIPIPSNVAIVDVYSKSKTDTFPVVFWSSDNGTLTIIDPANENDIYYLQSVIHISLPMSFCCVEIDNKSPDRFFYDFDQTSITQLDVCLQIAHHLLYQQTLWLYRLLNPPPLSPQTKLRNLLKSHFQKKPVEPIPFKFDSSHIYDIHKGIKNISNRRIVNKSLRFLPHSINFVSFDDFDKHSYDINEFYSLLESLSAFLYLIQLIRYPITFANLIALDELVQDQDFDNLHSDFLHFQKQSELSKSKLQDFGSCLGGLYHLLQNYFYHNLIVPIEQ